ncbi:MAG: hypothetical protein AAGE94_18925, partial [Acidobacteriota bacterium]
MADRPLLQPPALPIHRGAAAWFAELARPSAEAWAQVTDDGVNREASGGGPLMDLLIMTLDEQAEPASADLRRRRSWRDTPALASWRRACRTGAPLAFVRVLLEVVRRQSLDLTLADPPKTWLAVIELLDQPALAIAAPSRHDGLLALAFAYLADEYRVLGDQRRAEQYLASARHVVDGGHDPEVRASILEVRAELWNEQGALGRCQADLDVALDLLGAEHHHVTGRRAQTLYRRGRLDYRRDRFEDALPFLRQARRELPADLDLRLRVDLLHVLAFTYACLGRDDEAEDCLRALDALPSTYDTDRLVGQRSWLRGRVHARAGRLDRAIGALRRATTSLTAAGLTFEGLRAFAALTDLYSRQGELPARDSELRSLFAETFRQEHFTRLRTEDLERIAQTTPVDLRHWVRSLPQV